MTEARQSVEKKQDIERIQQLVTVMLAGKQPDERTVLDELEYLRTRFPSLDDEDIAFIARRLAEHLNISLDRGTVITSEDYEPWLQEQKRGYDWARWGAYRTLLVQQGRAPQVIEKTDDLTDHILDLVGDPAIPGTWARRGLVLGDVQSGKTGTYLGLFNKAADVGYRLIILLSGNTEVLRRQTQARVDEAFIGRDSSREVSRRGTAAGPGRHIGIGTIRADLAHATGMTTVLRDFRKSSQEATSITIPEDAAHPYVFVLKKNKAILTAVTQWLEEQASSYGGRLRTPVLVLDDESDYASVNTRDDEDPTAINKAIRDILAICDRSSYVAFTATPFANIFVNHEIDNDLFPKDFVYALDAPSNYVGSESTFGDDNTHGGLAIPDDVDESIPLRHQSGLNVESLPESLLDAVHAFYLANTIRDLRGQEGQARSMLVNVSRFKKVQAQVAERLQEEVRALTNLLQLHGANGQHRPELGRLRRVFEEQYADCGTSWESVAEALPNSSSDIRVGLFNSDRDRRLAEDETATWDRPARLIAVGGDVLSRGLTLEGLVVSFFHRAVTASDTLMQMARWFGYRDGYEDLCRLWINADAADNYRRAADSIDELRLDLRMMLQQQLTPADFGLAVRKHPDALLITARNKMRNAQSVNRVVSITGRRLETTKLLVGADGQPVTKNHQLVTAFLSELTQTHGPATHDLKWPRWTRVNHLDIAEFVGSWIPAPNDPFFSGSSLSTWIRRAKAERFAQWDVAVAVGASENAKHTALATPHATVRRPLLTSRESLGKSNDVLRVSGARSRLAGPSDIQAFVPATELRLLKDEAAKLGRMSPPETWFYPGLARPLLVIYPLMQPTDGPVTSDSFIPALKIAVPGSSANARDNGGDVEYVINTVAQRNWLSEMVDGDEDDLDA